MAQSQFQLLRQQRRDKLKRLQDLGNPYPQPDLSHKQSISQARASLNQNVTLAGRIMSLRGHGKILFADLLDRSGRIQLFFEQNTLQDLMPQTKLLDLGDIISVSGGVFTTQAGEITVKVTQFQILAKNLRPLPEKWHGLKDVEERYRQRYVDLIVNPEVKKVFEVRTRILSEMRRFLDDHGFMEVETPILQPIYGGASAKPFITHHNTLDANMYLRISDELYLKRLIVGGLEKVYEVSRDFRNEGVSRFHNPEFTQIEFYWAYVDYEVLMTFTEKLVTHVLTSVLGTTQVTYQDTVLDFTPPFPRLTFRDAIYHQTSIDIDIIKTEEEFFRHLKDRQLKLDLNGVVGLGALFDALYKEYVRPHLVGPVFITDYPASMIALAKRKDQNPDKIASFQLLAKGTELLKAYNELNDPADQADRWLEEEALAKRGAEAAMQLDTDYIRALEYGMPPTAGWGMGIDRFTQFITNQPTIKDVILFPTLRPETIDSPDSDSFDTDSETSSSNIVIGQVESILKHPQADSLMVCQVKVSPKEKLQIITSCQNLRANDLVAVALPGAIVPTLDGQTQKIKKTKLRGVETEAMMCSPFELGLSQNHSCIHILAPDLLPHLGQPVKSFLS
jgi:lysyl-tRNA synthetase class 2